MIKYTTRLTSQTLCLLLLMTSISANSAQSNNLPDFGSSVNQSLSVERERLLGNSIMRELRASQMLWSDPLTSEYIQALGNKLAFSSPVSTGQFRFFVVNDHRINAFALPGGNIGINMGLITTAQSESELAGVMAHEIAHVTQRHIARFLERSSNMSVPTIAALLGSILIATQNPEAGAGALMATMGASQQMAINFTRDNEEEADRIGIGIMANANINPNAMAIFFERMQLANRYNQFNYPEFLLTHPVNQQRIADARLRAAAYDYKSTVNDSLAFHLIRTRIMVLSDNTNPRENMIRFRESLKNEQYINKEATQYGYALSLLQVRDYPEAKNQINTLLKQRPYEIAYLLLQADIEYEEGHKTESLALLTKGLDIYPNQYALSMRYADFLVRDNEPSKASQILKTQAQLHPEDPMVFERLGHAQAAAGLTCQARQSHAAYLALLGNIPGAIAQLDKAQFLPTCNSPSSKASLTHRKQALQELMDKEEKASKL